MAQEGSNQEPTEDEASVLKKEGNAQFKAGAYQAAIDAYSRSLELDPQQHLCYSNRSAAYLKLGNSAEEALRDAQRCVELAPNWPKGYSRQAAALQELKRWDEALAICTSGLALSAEGPDPALEKMRVEVQTRRFQEKIRDTWHGRVSDQLGGYEQEMEFLDESRVRVDVMGRSIVGTYWLDCGPEPHHLNIQVQMANDAPPGVPPPPPVPYIVKVDSEGLHLCCPYAQIQRPTEFKGEGYCLMTRGPLNNASDDAGEIAKLSEEERFLMCTREVTAVLPDRKIEEPKQTESEEVVRDKIMAQVRFENSMFTVQKRFGEETMQEVLSAAKDPASAPASLKGNKEIEKLRIKLKVCGILEEGDSMPSPPPAKDVPSVPSQSPLPPKPTPPPPDGATTEVRATSEDTDQLEASSDNSLYIAVAVVGAMAVALTVAMLWRKQKH